MSPTVKFDEKTLARHSAKQGVYASLKSTTNVVGLKVAFVSIVEASFREYARKHVGCTQAMENKEWERFKKHLLKYL